jgi:hypothetical protein
MTNLINDLFEDDRLYFARDIAKILRTSKMSVCRWLKDGDIKSIKLPHSHYNDKFIYQVKGSEVNYYLANLNAKNEN